MPLEATPKNVFKNRLDQSLQNVELNCDTIYDFLSTTENIVIFCVLLWKLLKFVLTVIINISKTKLWRMIRYCDIQNSDFCYTKM